MVTKEKLNNLVVNAARGDEISRDELYKIFLPIIERMSRWSERFLRDVTVFEQRCLKIIIAEALRFDHSRGSDYYRLVVWKFRGAASYLYRRQSRRHKEFQLCSYDETDITCPEYEIEDVLANVEDVVLYKEKIAFLAEGDPRNLAILTAWTNGYSDSDTASFLAKRIGGNSESHRKYVQRYRKACQKALAHAI